MSDINSIGDPIGLIRIARAGSGPEEPAEPLDLGRRVRELRKARSEERRVGKEC